MRTYSFNTVMLMGLVSAVLSTTGLYSSDYLRMDPVNSKYMAKETIYFQGKQQNVYVGAMTGSLNGTDMFFFCYDLNHTIHLSGSYFGKAYTPTSNNIPASLGLASVFNRSVATSMLNSKFSSLKTTNDYVAMQLAIWTVLYNWTPSKTSNVNTHYCLTGFCVPGISSVLANTVNSYLAIAKLYAANYPNGQNLGNWTMVTSTSFNHTNQVIVGISTPEPQSYLLLGSFLALSIMLARFYKKSESNSSSK